MLAMQPWHAMLAMQPWHAHMHGSALKRPHVCKWHADTACCKVEKPKPFAGAINRRSPTVVASWNMMFSAPLSRAGAISLRYTGTACAAYYDCLTQEKIIPYRELNFAPNKVYQYCTKYSAFGHRIMLKLSSQAWPDTLSLGWRQVAIQGRVDAQPSRPGDEQRLQQGKGTA